MFNFNNTKINFLSNEIILKFEQYNFNYPYSIIKIINENNLINNVLIDMIINNLELYFNHLYTKFNIKPNNLSKLGIKLYEASTIIKDYLLTVDVKENSFTNEFNNEVNHQIELLSQNYFIQDSTNKMIKIILDNSDKEINFENNQETKNYILGLINTYDFPYRDNLFKFFLDLNYEQVFKFRKTFSAKRLKYSCKRFLILIKSLSELFDEFYKAFERDINFTYNFIQKSYFYNISDTRMFILNSLCIKDFEEDINEFDRFRIMNNFFNGIMNLRNFYLINFEDINNYSCGIINELSNQRKYQLFKKIIKLLKNEDINTIYQVKSLSYNDITKNDELVKKINEIPEHIINTNIKIRKQELSKDNYLILNFIKEKLYKNDNSNYKITNIEYYEYSSGIKSELIIFNISYQNIIFKVKIIQLNLQLFSYIYIDKKLINKDRIFRIDDFDRIYYIIKEYNHIKN